MQLFLGLQKLTINAFFPSPWDLFDQNWNHFRHGNVRHKIDNSCTLTSMENNNNKKKPLKSISFLCSTQWRWMAFLLVLLIWRFNMIHEFFCRYEILVSLKYILLFIAKTEHNSKGVLGPNYLMIFPSGETDIDLWEFRSHNSFRLWNNAVLFRSSGYAQCTDNLFSSYNRANGNWKWQLQS